MKNNIVIVQPLNVSGLRSIGLALVTFTFIKSYLGNLLFEDRQWGYRFCS